MTDEIKPPAWCYCHRDEESGEITFCEIHGEFVFELLDRMEKRIKSECSSSVYYAHNKENE